jgi:hypothetical protein
MTFVDETHEPNTLPMTEVAIEPVSQPVEKDITKIKDTAD